MLLRYLAALNGHLRSEPVRLAVLQGLITIIAATATYHIVAPMAGEAVVFGGCVAMAGTLFLAWRSEVGARRQNLGAQWILRHAYRTAIERFMLVALLLAAGFKLLRLAPLWMLAGFIFGQLVWLAIPGWVRLKK